MLLTNFISSTILCTAVYVSVLYYKKPNLTKTKSGSSGEKIKIENPNVDDELTPLTKIVGLRSEI